MARVWDRFLTDQDREHIQVQPRKPLTFGTRPALLLIDNYRSALGDAPKPLLESVKDWPSSTGLAGWEAIENIRKLLTGFRSRNLPVIHCTQLGEEETGIPNWNFFRSSKGLESQRGERGWHALRSRAKGLHEKLSGMSAEEYERFLRRYEIVKEVAPIAGEALIKKSGPSAFWNTPLAIHLAALEVDTLIVTGESTSGCVRASVVDAASHRLPVIVVEECVYDRHEASHAINLFDMDRKYAEVLSLQLTFEYLEQVIDGQRDRDFL